ncbi:MAG TPA: type II toxin-antitoxin system VapB family antitoxin [Gemmatimonadaceae bacterium]|nr:type II toxin-antitoxin system VapB family antitoxin [Gemmatimonadaceae bacterium]
MALNIKNPRADALAHELARETGESLTDAVLGALEMRLAAVRGAKRQRSLYADVARIQAFVREQPVRDARRPDEILGYDDTGLPR